MPSQSEYDALVNALSAATAEEDAATYQYQLALQSGDHAGAAEAQRRLNRASNQIIHLSGGKEAMDAEMNDPQSHQHQAQPQQWTPQQIDQWAAQTINSMGQLLPQERDWLMQRKHLITNQVNQQRLQVTYADAVQRGLERGSPEYFDFFEQRLGDAPGGQPMLTRAQKQAAADSGISESEYAKQYRIMKERQHDSASLFGYGRSNG